MAGSFRLNGKTAPIVGYGMILLSCCRITKPSLRNSMAIQINYSAHYMWVKRWVIYGAIRQMAFSNRMRKLTKRSARKEFIQAFYTPEIYAMLIRTEIP